LKSTVLLCSDAPILGEGLAALLAQAGDFDLISCCPKTDDLSDQLAYHQPNVLLIDLSTVFTFDQFSGLKELGERTKIVLWVHSISTEMASQAMSLGVRGILRKVGPIEALLRCLVRVKEGGLWFENGLADSMRSALRRCTERKTDNGFGALMSNTVHTHEEVQMRAYQFWQDRGRPWGTPETDWFRAEHELADMKTGLVDLAREVGGALGSLAAFVTDRLPQQD
jgi:DNA-binding NarL/FixJ family response regulator